MRRALVLLLSAAAAVVPVSAAPAGQLDHCCVEANLEASYLPSAKRISARWADPPAGVTADVVRAGDRLGADGIVDAASPRSVVARARGGSASFGAGPLALLLDRNAGVFVQVRFTCRARTPRPCASGAFWSKPVHVTTEEPAGKGGGKELETIGKRVRIVSNGTEACTDALATVRGLIDRLRANTAAAKRAFGDGRSTKPYSRLQTALLGRLTAAETAARAACKK